jgi:hypothetical protein
MTERVSCFARAPEGVGGRAVPPGGTIAANGDRPPADRDERKIFSLLVTTVEHNSNGEVGDTNFSEFTTLGFRREFCGFRTRTERGDFERVGGWDTEFGRTVQTTHF